MVFSLQIELLGVRVDCWSHSVYIDNLFANDNLPVHLSQTGFEITVTTDNRLGKCLLKEKTLVIKEQRGSHDYRFEINNEIPIVKGLSTKHVTIRTNYY